MSNVNEAIDSLLSGDAAIIAVIPADSITVGRRQQNQPLPAITFELITGRPEEEKDFPTLERLFYEISIWHEIERDATTAANAIKTKLQRFSGTVLGVIIDLVFFDDQREQFDEKAQTFLITQTFEFLIK